MKICQERGIVVEQVESLGGAKAVSLKGKIQLTADCGDMILAHELGHELLHGKQERLELPRAQKEFEAEMVAASIGAIFGYDTSTSTVYLTGWGATRAGMEKTMNRISSIVGQIAKAVNGNLQEETA